MARNPYTSGRVIVPISMPPELAQILKMKVDKGQLSKYVCQLVRAAIAKDEGIEIVKPCLKCLKREAEEKNLRTNSWGKIERPSKQMVQCTNCGKIMNKLDSKKHKCGDSR